MSDGHNDPIRVIDMVRARLPGWRRDFSLVHRFTDRERA